MRSLGRQGRSYWSGLRSLGVVTVQVVDEGQVVKVVKAGRKLSGT